MTQRRRPGLRNIEKASLPGLIDLGDVDRCELHGFEVEICGRVVVPELHPHFADELSASMRFESELREAIDAAA